MVPNKGLFTDCAKIDQPEGTWSDAWNLLASKKKGAFTSDEGADLTAIGYPAMGALPIGTTVFPDGSYVVYSTGTDDRIGIVDVDGNYTDIIVDAILNFDNASPIRASEIDYNYLGERIISWTDRRNPPRILNIDNVPFPLTGGKALVDVGDIKDLLAFPTFKTPNLTFVVNKGNGAVKAGAYSFAIAYENNDGTRTNNTIPQGNLHITEDTGNTFNTYDGVEPGSITSKSIRISLTNLDPNFDKIVLIVIKSIKGIISAHEVRKINNGGLSATIDYLGTESEIDLPLEEILTPRPLYIKTAAMTQIKGVLYHGNLETEADIDYQAYANNIRIFYNSRLVAVNDLNNSHKSATLPTGFGHGEVYAFYINLVLKNGTLSRAFHIPGRAIYGGESPSPTSTSPQASQTGLSGSKVYQIDNTTDKAGHTYTTDADGTKRVTSTSANTNMGYWENENEVYPSNFPGIAGQKVRHHVFPSMRDTQNRFYSGELEYMKSKLDLLGIDVAGVVIPVELQDKVEGWVISYAKKDYSSSINYGQDLVLYTARQPGSTGDVDFRFDIFANGNIDWSIGPPSRDLLMTKDQIRGHSIDLLIDKPQLSVNKLYVDIEVIYKATIEDTANQYVKRVSADNRDNLVMLVDYINGPSTASAGNNKVLPVIPSRIVRAISELKYIPNGVIDGDIINNKSGEAIAIKFNAGDLNITGFSTANIDFNDSTNTDFNEDTALYTIKQVKSNVHSLYNQQELILTNKINLTSTSGVNKVHGGDRFIINRTIMQVGANSNDISREVNRAMMIRHHIAESRYNYGLRYEVPGNLNVKYYPKSTADSFLNTNDDGQSIIFEYGANTSDTDGYYKDYNLINIFNPSIIYEPSQITTNKFPNRIIRSGFAGNNQNGLNSWKTYLSNDIYDTNRNRGEIVNLSALDDILLIHHLYGLFRTLGKERLTFDTTEVYLGSGDIFGQEPKEPIPSKLGYLGTQNVFSCCTFKNGYAWCDQKSGRIFLLRSSGIIEISSIGMYNFFRDNLLIDNTLPDNIVGNGLLCTHDPKYNRLIFTKKAGQPFTISFSLEEGENYWVSFHEYTPDYLFCTNDNFYSFQIGGASNKIYKMNSPTKKAMYYNSFPKETSISLIFNQLPKVNKIVFNTNWISEFYDTSGNLNLDKTLTKIRVKTNYQDSGDITLTPYSTFGAAHNIRAERSTWNFNKLKDANADVFKRKPIVGNYAEIKYSFDNATNLDSSQNSLYLYDFNVKVRKAEI